MDDPETIVSSRTSYTSSGAKRNLSGPVGDEERVIKRRAARACQSCRARKVRCDFLVNGEHCTNCKLDNIDCVLLTSRRGKVDKTQRQEREEWRPATSPASPEVLNAMSMASDDEEHPNPVTRSSMSTTLVADDVPVCLTFDDEDVRLESSTGRDDRSRTHQAQGDYRHQTNLPMEPWTQIQASVTQQSLSVHSDPASFSTPYLPTALSPESQLPPFIKPLPVDADFEDVSFLVRKGAFLIPEPELRAEILQGYVLSVHPFLPVLDLKEFLDVICSDGNNGQVSLLLFQAVMFAGLSSLKPLMVQKTGYETLKQARKAFFARVCLLHDFEIEQDNTAVVQALLLMSFWYEKWNSRRHTWYWSGQALSLAQSMGFHRGKSAPGLPTRVQHLRRRIWWSVYIRDRLIGLGTRRPMRIQDDQFDVPMLTVQDFQSGPLDVSFGAPGMGLRIELNASQSRCLALMCIELAKLCVCIGHILSSQYTTLGEHTSLTSTLMVSPRGPQERAKNLLKCDDELQQWYQNLDPEAQRLAIDSANKTSAVCLGIPWSILNMIYLTSVSVLHRPQVLQSCLNGPQEAEAQRHSRERVKHTARKLTKILYSMLRRDQVRFLPTSGIPAALSAGLGHMLEIKSKDEDVRDASIFRFYQTMQVMQRLREIYASADAAASFLAVAVRKSGLSARIQLSGQEAPALSTTDKGNDQNHPSGRSPKGPSNRPAHPQPARVFDRNMQFHRGGATSGGEFDHQRARRTSGVPDQHSAASQDSRLMQEQTNPVYVTEVGSVSGGSTGQVLSSRPADRDANDMRIENTVEIPDSGVANHSDLLSYWVVDDDYFTMNGNLDHFISEEPISLSYDFCSDAFGLLDGLMPDGDDLDTLRFHT